MALAAGCDPGPVYDGAGTNLLGTRIPSVGQWSAAGTVSNPAQAIDGNIHTAATAANHDANSHLTIDLGKICGFNMVVIDHGREEHGFALRVEVKVSQDGRGFTTVYRGTGTRRVSTFLLDRYRLARFVRIEAAAPGAKPWSIAELHFQ